MELFAADGHDAGGCERVTGKSGMRPAQGPAGRPVRLARPSEPRAETITSLLVRTLTGGDVGVGGNVGASSVRAIALVPFSWPCCEAWSFIDASNRSSRTNVKNRFPRRPDAFEKVSVTLIPTMASVFMA